MSDNLQRLRKKILDADELGHVVRTMKALSASKVTQFRQAVEASVRYHRDVELGLAMCLQRTGPLSPASSRSPKVGLIVIGSDQGLVGQFNETLATYALEKGFAQFQEPKLWVIGERMAMALQTLRKPISGIYSVPTSVPGVAPLVGQLLSQVEVSRSREEVDTVLVFHNQPRDGGSYAAASQRLLPFDQLWMAELEKARWPRPTLPEVIDPAGQTLSALIREYLFLALFRACAESLASENISRVVAMQAAQENIKDTLEDLTRRLHHVRQDSIDEELFDVVSSFEALRSERRQGGSGDRYASGS